MRDVSSLLLHPYFFFVVWLGCFFHENWLSLLTDLEAGGASLWNTLS